MRIIKGYSDFLNFMIAESIIHQTTDFRNFLEYLYYKGGDVSQKVQQILRAIHRMDVKTNINYIGISTRSNDELSFIPDSQFQRFMSQSERDISLKTKSFTSVGRAFRQLLTSFGIPFNDKEIELFANEYKSWWDNNYSNKKFEIVKGQEILKWYLEENYSARQSTLGNSCMRYHDRNHYMKLYAENPDTISMCIVKEGDKISARALLWTLESGEMLLDRIYYTEDSLQNFVQDNTVKALNKKIYSYYTGNTVEGMVVNIQNSIFDRYPYADTMCYVYQKLVDGKPEGTGKISNSRNLKFEGDWRLFQIQSTSGEPSEISHVYSTAYKVWILSSEAIYSQSLSSYVHKSDLNYSKYLNSYLDKEYSVYSDDINDFIPKEYAIVHPELGLVPSNYIFKVFYGYKKKDFEPIEFYKDTKDDNLENFEFKEELLFDRDNYIRIGKILFKMEDLSFIDSIDEYFPKIGVEQAYELTRNQKDNLIEKGLEFLIIRNKYILKIDADILKLKNRTIHYLHPYYDVVKSIIKIGKLPFDNWIETIEDENLKQERLNKLNAYDKFLDGDIIWTINTRFGGNKDKLIEIYMKTFESVFEHGDSEKAFTYRGKENLDLFDLLNEGLFEYYGKKIPKNTIKEYRSLFIKCYKIMLMIYYIEGDTHDSKRFTYSLFNSSERSILGNTFGNSDDTIEAIRESLRKTYRVVFNLVPGAYEIISELDESIGNIDFDNIKRYLRDYIHNGNGSFKLFYEIE